MKIQITYTEGLKFYAAYLYELDPVSWSKKIRSVKDFNEWLLTKGVRLQVERAYNEEKLEQICSELHSKHGMVAGYDHNFDVS